MACPDEVQERCEGCGQLMTLTATSLPGDVKASRCGECVAAQTTAQPAPRRAPAHGDSFSIHSLVGDTAVSQRQSAAPATASSQQASSRPKHATTPTSASASPFLAQAAAAHAQYYALAASGLLPALNYGGRSSRMAALPIDWAPPTGLAAKHRYGV